MNIKQSTRSYEKWVREHISVVDADLKRKHEGMALDMLFFLRATFYRWAQTFPETCPELISAPSVLSVGDLHFENYGTWRDSEGRLNWGVNDFDECSYLPYTNDIVRLLTSTKVAIRTGRLDMKVKEACRLVLKGYVQGLQEGGHPFVLAEGHDELRRIAVARLKHPGEFWAKLDENKPPRATVPPACIRVLQNALPEPQMDYRLLQRQSGAGSLGRQRIVAIAEWHGGRVAREAKATLPSAWLWANGKAKGGIISVQQIIEGAVRCRDPFFVFADGWTVRRLAPDCVKLELGDLPRDKDERMLLQAIGYEAANIHVGTPGAAEAILSDLKRRPDDWLIDAVKRMYKRNKSDYQDWKS